MTTNDSSSEYASSLLKALQAIRQASNASECLDAAIRACSIVTGGAAVGVAFQGQTPICLSSWPESQAYHKELDLAAFPGAERVKQGIAQSLPPFRSDAVFRIPEALVSRIGACPFYMALATVRDSMTAEETSEYESSEPGYAAVWSPRPGFFVDEFDERRGTWRTPAARVASQVVRTTRQRPLKDRDYVCMPIWEGPPPVLGSHTFENTDLLALIVFDCDSALPATSIANEQLALISEAVSLSLERQIRNRESLRHTSASSSWQPAANSLPLGLIIHADYKIRYMSDPLVRMLKGGQAEDYIGRPVSEILSPCQQVFAASVMSDVYARRVPTGWVKTRMIDGHGELIDVEIFGTPIEHEGVPAYQTAVIDVTERIREAEWLSRKHLEVAHMSRLRMIGELVGEIVQELTQPISAVANYSSACQTLLRRHQLETGHALANDVLPASIVSDEERLFGWLDALNTAAERVGDQMERLRTMVRRNRPLRERVRLVEVVDTCIRLAAQIAEKSHIKIKVVPFDDTMVVEVDPIQIEQVVFNLLCNAIEATVEAERANATIEISVVRSASRVEVLIRDAGDGVAESVCERMFEPFFSTKPQGMGMGLTISKSIIEAHDGQLALKQSSDQGSTFGFTLVEAQGI